jgi:UrcA family protein
MAAKLTSSRALTLISFSAAALLASSIVGAQTQGASSESAQLPQVQVEAEGTVIEKTPVEGQPAAVGQTRASGTMERVTMTRKISASDLDLSTPEGVKELHKRIETTARSECNEIRSLSGPLSTQARGYETVNENCVKDAVTAARKQADVMVAAAGGKKPHG